MRRVPVPCLVWVDLQNDFMPGGALAVSDGDAVVPVANRLAEKFERVVATQDWHPPNHGSFVTQHPGRQVGEVIMLHGLPQVLWPVHCVQESFGASFHPRLTIPKGVHIVRKGTDLVAETLTADDTLRMPEIDVEVPMAEFYTGIEITDEPAAESA